MSEIAISVRGLTKAYGSLIAIDGVDLEVKRGQVFALLGPNGAGKTTTIEILEGYRTRTAGEVSVLGHDPAQGGRTYKEKIGIVLQETGVQPYLTVAEVIDLYRGYYPSPLGLDEVIRIVGLEQKSTTRVNKLSGGQKRRLDVGVGLAGNPDLLFLDEPTTGFDPSARRNAWGMIKELSALGKTVVLTTHYMDEAQNLADHAAIMVAGKIVAQGPPRALAAATTQGTRISFRLGARDPLPPQKIVKGATVKRRAYVIETAAPVQKLHELTAWAMRRKVELMDLSVSHPSLEDMYLQLTKNEEVQP